uniref:Uncharacterized protein n=1 Tax=Cacopsylla melanoneura TaxID=428564 RepID=A0A8D8YGI8_9HEMI
MSSLCFVTHGKKKTRVGNVILKTITSRDAIESNFERSQMFTNRVNLTHLCSLILVILLANLSHSCSLIPVNRTHSCSLILVNLTHSCSQILMYAADVKIFKLIKNTVTLGSLFAFSEKCTFGTPCIIANQKKNK